MEDLVSVVVAVYNGAQYLGQQLESILSQTHRRLEVLVLDDGSADDSRRIAESFAARDGRVRLETNQMNLGLVSNFLKGVSMASGEYALFCDQDDWWRPDKIEILKTLLQKDEKNVLAYSNIEICDESLKPQRRSFWQESRIRPREGIVGEKSLLRNLMPGCSMMFRRKVAKAIAQCLKNDEERRLNFSDVLDETPFMHDHLVFVLSAGFGRIVYSKERLVRYRQHNRNNIGAFYQATGGRERMARLLRRRLEFLKQSGMRWPQLDLEKLEKFCVRLEEEKRGFFKSDFLSYYLFMREDTLSGKILGTLECAAPGAYARLQKAWK